MDPPRNWNAIGYNDLKGFESTGVNTPVLSNSRLRCRVRTVVESLPRSKRPHCSLLHPMFCALPKDPRWKVFWIKLLHTATFPESVHSLIC